MIGLANSGHYSRRTDLDHRPGGSLLLEDGTVTDVIEATGPNAGCEHRTFVYTKRVFEWDANKAGANLAKHGVSFDEATTVFADPVALDGPDLGHSSDEARFLRLGRSVLDRVLMVAYTQRKSSHGEAVRIISARRASRKERAAYLASVED